MLFFLSVAVCAVLVTAFVIALRRHHQQAFTRAIEREQGLPPLTDVALDIEQLMPEEFARADHLNSDFFETSIVADAAGDDESVHHATASRLTTSLQADHSPHSTTVSAEPSVAAQSLPAAEQQPSLHEHHETTASHLEPAGPAPAPAETETETETKTET